MTSVAGHMRRQSASSSANLPGTQVERPDQIAGLIREALKHIPAERLIISSDCGMGREGMARRHAAYKMVAMVLGTNIVRKELSLPEASCRAADARFSLTLTKA